MLSVVYVTSRGLWPMLDPVVREFSQYQVLSNSLRAQNVQSFELVCVDQRNKVPRHELAWLGDRVRYVRPRETPWRALGAFGPASARNDGLAVAHGEIVLGLDDCISFGPRLIEQVLDCAAGGEYLAPDCVAPSDSPAGGSQRAHQNLVGGILAYPRLKAIAIGGHEERFDGSIAFEDWEFSERLIRAGVTFVKDTAARVTLFDHSRENRRSFRCAYLVRHLLNASEQGNAPWTAEQLEMITGVCPFSVGGTGCGLNGGKCDQPRQPTEEAVNIMRGYESRQWLDLPGSIAA